VKAENSDGDGVKNPQSVFCFPPRLALFFFVISVKPRITRSGENSGGGHFGWSFISADKFPGRKRRIEINFQFLFPADGFNLFADNVQQGAFL
jgi:hypothetical protein